MKLKKKTINLFNSKIRLIIFKLDFRLLDISQQDESILNIITNNIT